VLYNRPMSSRNRLSALLAVVTVGLVSFSALPLPVKHLSVHGRELVISGRTILGYVIASLVCSGSQTLMLRVPHTGQETDAWRRFHCVLPTLAATVALLLLAGPWGATVQFVICVLTVVMMAVVIIGEHYTADLAPKLRQPVRGGLELCAFGLLTVLFGALRLFRAETGPVGAIVALSGMSVASWLLSEDAANPGQLLVSAVMAGVALGVAASLLAAIASARAYALLLTILLYILTGVQRRFLRGQLQRASLVEYLLVGLLAVTIVLIFVH